MLFPLSLSWIKIEGCLPSIAPELENSPVVKLVFWFQKIDKKNAIFDKTSREKLCGPVSRPQLLKQLLDLPVGQNRVEHISIGFEEERLVGDGVVDHKDYQN